MLETFYAPVNQYDKEPVMLIGKLPLRSRLACLGVLVCWAVQGGSAMGDEPLGEAQLDIQADSYEFQPETGEAVGQGNVRITYVDMVLTADQARLNLKTKDIEAQGNIVFHRGVFSWRGNTIRGNFDTREFWFDQYAATTGVWHARGEGGMHEQSGRISLEHAQLSTCENERPHYSISARRIVYHADGTFRAYHAVYKVNNIPVFYWPILFGDTKAAGGNIEIKPGYSSDWGPYLLLGREWRLTESLRTKMMLHFRAKNGIAVGNRTRMATDRSESELLLYGMRDNDSPETEAGFNRRFKVEKDRYRARLWHWQALTDDLTLRLRADALSDIHMLEDWFRREYRDDPQPKSYADLTHESERFTLSLAVRPRVNEFFTVLEKLPELRLELPRQALADTGLQYQGESSVAKLKMRWRDFDKDRAAGLTDPQDYDAWRLDSLHMLYYPVSIGDALQVIPRAGIRLTYYDKSSQRRLSRADLDALFEVDDPDNPDTLTAIVNYDEDGGSKLRVAGEVGLELKTKFYRVWPDLRSPLWGIDGLRHIVQPYANYTVAPKPSVRREQLMFFDSVDRLLEQHFVRLGAQQRLQTRRNQRIYTLARMETYADFHFAKESGFHHLGNLGNRVELNPTDDLQFWGTLIADMGEPDISRAETGIRFGNPRRCVAALSYVYWNRHSTRSAHSMGTTMTDFSGENSLLSRSHERSHYATASLEFPINDKTAGEIRYEYDIVENTLARQVYQITRDLHCWMGALRLEEDNGDLRVMLLLYLKAFPQVRIDSSF